MFMNNLATACNKLRRADEAIALFGEVLSLEERKLARLRGFATGRTFFSAQATEDQKGGG
jgi:hypothetical protein